jgi:hypothetical protein
MLYFDDTAKPWGFSKSTLRPVGRIVIRRYESPGWRVTPSAPTRPTYSLPLRDLSEFAADQVDELRGGRRQAAADAAHEKHLAIECRPHQRLRDEGGKLAGRDDVARRADRDPPL